MELAELDLVPQDFLDLGRHTLEDISFNPRDLQDSEEGNELCGELSLGVDLDIRQRLLPLTLGERRVSVIGVDATNVDLGITRHGLLCAFRGTVVKVEDGRYGYARYGPFLFHITPKNRRVLYDGLRQAYLGWQSRKVAPPLEKMADSIRTILERWLQQQSIASNNGAIILWDGSLSAPITSKSVLVLSRMLREARERGNRVMALSKKTSLTLNDGIMYDLIDSNYAPSLLDIDAELRLSYGSRIQFLGYVYAAKLAHSSFTFRLDIDRGLPVGEAVNSVEKLLVSDGLRENYPETLRLAHVLSKFSTTEIIAMQRLIRERYGLRFSSMPNIREVVFGPLESVGHGQTQGVSTP